MQTTIWRHQKFIPVKRQPHKMVQHTQRISRQQSTNCLSVFDHFVGLVVKGKEYSDGKFDPFINSDGGLTWSYRLQKHSNHIRKSQQQTDLEKAW